MNLDRMGGKKIWETKYRWTAQQWTDELQELRKDKENKK